MEMTSKFRDDTRVKPPRGETRSEVDEILDEALYDTFPASDPVSLIQKVEPTAPPRGEEIDRKPAADQSKRR